MSDGGSPPNQLLPPWALHRRLRRRVLSISPSETSFAVRGFHCDHPDVRAQLECHGAAFVHGFNLALEAEDCFDFADRAVAIPAAERGFAYEGAAMATAVLDLLAFGRGRRLEAFIKGSGEPHVYMIHVGAGWAIARLHRLPWGWLRGLDPILRWLALDGYGFHEGFFSPGVYVRGKEQPWWPNMRWLDVFDQGLGRSLWFIDGADVERIAATVAGFPSYRHADLWSGVGLAAAYAGAADWDDLEQLGNLAGEHRWAVGQGAAFAVAARLRAGNPVDHTEVACNVLCGCETDAAARLVASALHGIEPDGDGAGYDRWRARIRHSLARVPAPV